MIKIIKRIYKPEYISSNIHLLMHISQCIQDYRSVYSFWLFPFERLNRYIVLTSFLHSNISIIIYFYIFLYIYYLLLYLYLTFILNSLLLIFLSLLYLNSPCITDSLTNFIDKDFSVTLFSLPILDRFLSM